MGHNKEKECGYSLVDVEEKSTFKLLSSGRLREPRRRWERGEGKRKKERENQSRPSPGPHGNSEPVVTSFKSRTQLQVDESEEDSEGE